MGIKSAKARKRQENKHAGHTVPVLRTADEFQEYAKIIKVLGDCRFRVVMPDNKECLAILCRKMFRRQWVAKDQIVLVSLRDFQEDKVDIIHRYSDDDCRMLARAEHIPPWFLTPGVEKAPAAVASEFTDDETFDHDLDNI